MDREGRRKLRPPDFRRGRRGDGQACQQRGGVRRAKREPRPPVLRAQRARPGTGRGELIMKEFDMTDTTERKDMHGKRRDSHWSRAGRSRLLRLGLLALVMLLALGNRGCPDGRAPVLSCDDVVMFLEPGTCKVFANPCSGAEEENPDGVWLGDYFNPEVFTLNLKDEQRALLAAGFYISTVRIDGQTTRSVCVGADMPRFFGEQVNFYYGLGREFGTA